MQERPEKFHESSEAVQAHLAITQGVIGRMATNSASCKAWCITLVSAILVIVADKGKPQYAAIAIIPAILFLALDAYYLALEKSFRASYNAFIHKLHHNDLVAEDLYAITPSGSLLRLFFGSLLSFSIWPLYLTLVALVFITKTLV